MVMLVCSGGGVSDVGGNCSGGSCNVVVGGGGILVV